MQRLRWRKRIIFTLTDNVAGRLHKVCSTSYRTNFYSTQDKLVLLERLKLGSNPIFQQICVNYAHAQAALIYQGFIPFAECLGTRLHCNMLDSLKQFFEWFLQVVRLWIMLVRIMTLRWLSPYQYKVEENLGSQIKSFLYKSLPPSKRWHREQYVSLRIRRKRVNKSVSIVSQSKPTTINATNISCHHWEKSITYWVLLW